MVFFMQLKKSYRRKLDGLFNATFKKNYRTIQYFNDKWLCQRNNNIYLQKIYPLLLFNFAFFDYFITIQLCLCHEKREREMIQQRMKINDSRIHDIFKVGININEGMKMLLGKKRKLIITWAIC